MVLPELIIGAGLLLVGRRLYWLFLGGMGFLVGLELGRRLLVGQPESTILIVALVIGVIGAIVAIAASNFVIKLAGFIGGAAVALALLRLFGIDASGVIWLVAAIIGGFIGLGLVSAVVDWALIILSSIAGANMVANATHSVDIVRQIPLLIVVAVLALVGIVVQSRALGQSK